MRHETGHAGKLVTRGPRDVSVSPALGQMSEFFQISTDSIENSKENINVGSIKISRILWRMIVGQDLLKVPYAIIREI